MAAWLRVCVCVRVLGHKRECFAELELTLKIANMFFFFSSTTEGTKEMAEVNGGAEQDTWRWKTWLSRPWPSALLPAQYV